MNSLCTLYPYIAAQYLCLSFGVNHRGLGLERDKKHTSLTACLYEKNEGTRFLSPLGKNCLFICLFVCYVHVSCVHHECVCMFMDACTQVSVCECVCVQLCPCMEKAFGCFPFLFF